MIAETKALGSGTSTSDHTYAAEQAILTGLAAERDLVAGMIKKVLSDAAAGVVPSRGSIVSGLALVNELLIRAQRLAAQY